ncbi:MAG: hypothetical protein Kow0099_13260 [Candidatus Abyssubacteria bacterium]
MNHKAAPILLINPNLMKPPVTPVAIDFLGSALRHAGHEVHFLDLAFEADIDSAITRALENQFLFVGLSVRNTDDSFFATRDGESAAVRLAHALSAGEEYSTVPGLVWKATKWGQVLHYHIFEFRTGKAPILAISMIRK